jgi:hypothetical protein
VTQKPGGKRNSDLVRAKIWSDGITRRIEKKRAKLEFIRLAKKLKALSAAATKRTNDKNKSSDTSGGSVDMTTISNGATAAAIPVSTTAAPQTSSYPLTKMALRLLV